MCLSSLITSGRGRRGKVKSCFQVATQRLVLGSSFVFLRKKASVTVAGIGEICPRKFLVCKEGESYLDMVRQSFLCGGDTS